MRSSYCFLLITFLFSVAVYATYTLGYSEQTAYLIFGGAMGVAVRLGYRLSESDHWNRENKEIRMMSQRIRELEEGEKSRTSSDTNTEQPPKNE